MQMPTMTMRRKLAVHPRYIQQNARVAVRDVFDALTELVTNVDDAYASAKMCNGRIEIEIERRRKGTPSVIKVRDHAAGFTTDDMDRKLGELGDRHNSGMVDGADVRGTNSRGAKDVAALGRVTFDSITSDGLYSSCRIYPNSEFESSPAEPVTTETRHLLGILDGSGTVVTVEVDPAFAASIPHHDNLVKKLSHLVPLREIMADSHREVYLTDLNKSRTDRVRYSAPDGVDCVKESLTVPGYPKARVELVIKRCKKSLEERGKFRAGGILVKSRRAVHEATLFAPEYEHDPLACRFFGRLTCEYIDDLWNEADERMEKSLSPDIENPFPILDPLRQAGLRRDHPFFQALQREVLKRLRPLVEEERQREAADRAQIENRETRRKLNELERIATKFMQEQQEQLDEDLDNPTDEAEVKGRVRDVLLSPPFCQMIVGTSRRVSLVVNQEKYPELAVGAVVQIHCETDEIQADRLSCPLEAHPTMEGLLRATWQITAHKATNTTAVKANVGSVVKQAVVEVVDSERDFYKHIEDLQFWRKQYTLRPNQSRRIRLVAPWPGVIPCQEAVSFSCDNKDILISGGDRTLYIREGAGIGECKINVACHQSDVKATLVAQVGGRRAQTDLIVLPPEGDAIKISLENVDYGNQRSHWDRGGNKLIIAGRHPSIRRYLGPEATNFPGQEKAQFKVLLAEIVAFAVCERILSRNIERNPDEYRDADFDLYMAARDELVSRFLPAAHESQLPKPL